MSLGVIEMMGLDWFQRGIGINLGSGIWIDPGRRSRVWMLKSEDLPGVSTV